jgi:alkyl sulfatase BDS1-like metallo-beta-lactamase superfamily hydrolase
LGYQAESAPWRNFYLTGAKELLSKDNVKTFGKRYLSSALSSNQFFDVIATRINGYAYDQNDLNINIFVTDSKEKLSVIYKNGVLSNRKGSWIEKSDVTLEITKGDLFTLFTNETNVEHLRSQNKLKVEGDIERLNEFLSHIEQPQTNFNIVEPQASYTLH